MNSSGEIAFFENLVIIRITLLVVRARLRRPPPRILHPHPPSQMVFHALMLGTEAEVKRGSP